MSGGIEHLMISGPLLLAMPVAAAAGAVTFLSPCCLPLVPGYLAYVTGMSGTAAVIAAPAEAVPVPAGAATRTQVSSARATSTRSALDTSSSPSSAAAASPSPVNPSAGTWSGTASSPAAAPAAGRPRGRAVAGTALFVLGFSALYTSYGVAFGSVGFVLRTHAGAVAQVVGGLMIVMGLLFAGVLDRFAFAGRVARPSVRPRAGLAGAPLLGVLFGLGWTPCVGPTLIAVLTLAATTGTAARGALLAFVYALGIGIPFLIVAFAFQRGMAVIGIARRHGRLITRIGGVMLVGIGVLEVTGAWNAAMAWIQVHWVAGYVPPI